MGAEDIGKGSMPIPRAPSIAYDPWADRVSGNPTTRVMEHVLHLELPEDSAEWNGIFELLLNAAGTNPNCTLETIARWKRKLIDVHDRAYSEGMEDVARQKAEKLLFEIRAFMSRGDNEYKGLSGVGSIITVHQRTTQDIRMPQQTDTTGFLGWAKKKIGG